MEPKAQLVTDESFQRVDDQTGELLDNEVVLVARVARKLVNKKRQARGLPPMRDKGKYGFTAYDCGPALAEYVQWLQEARGPA